MSKIRWRNLAIKVINKTMLEYDDCSLRDMKKHLRAAYPFGERKRWPYKVWCKVQKESLQRYKNAGCRFYPQYAIIPNLNCKTDLSGLPMFDQPLDQKTK